MSLLQISGFLTMLTVHLLMLTVGINHRTLFTFLQHHQTDITPPLYAFAMWIPVYVGLGLTSLYRKKGIWITGAMLLTGLWFVSLTLEWTLTSMILSIVIVILLAYLYYTVQNTRITLRSYFFSFIPISLYFGWMTFLMIINILLWASSFFTINFITRAFVIEGLRILGTLMIVLTSDFVYSGVITFGAIALNNPEIPNLSIIGVFAAGAVVGTLLLRSIRAAFK